MKNLGISFTAGKSFCCRLKLLQIARLTLLVFLVGTLQAFTLSAQQITVTGTVSDEAGTVLPGVNVVVLGTTGGTITNGDGYYSINVPSSESTLEFSYIGYLTQDIAVGGNVRIDVTMVEGTQELDEVVVTAYGTQQKRAVTGAQQTIAADELGDIPVSQVANKLQGKVSGVQINQITGIPGEAPFIRIRNAGSINANSDPLYVVDGFPIVGDLTGIAPEEIESITILKDASSTALYGSRAANGVVLIETKSASVDQMQVSVSAYAGVQVLPKKRVEMMNGTEFAQFKQETYLDRGIPLADIPPEFQNPEQYGEGTDWYNIMMDPAPIQDYSLTFRGGTEKYRASVVAGYFGQDGILLNSGYERFSLRMNSVYNATDWLEFGFNVAPSYAKNWAPQTGGAFWAGNLLYNSLLAWPIVEYKNPDGSLPLEAWIPGLDGFPTPNYYRAAQEIEHKDDNLRLLSNAYIAVSPIKGLVLKSSVNLQMSRANSLDWNPSTSFAGFAGVPPVTARLDLGNQNSQTWLNENTVTYDLEVNGHSLNLLAGYTVQKYYDRGMSIRAEQFPDDRINDVDAAINIIENGTNSSVNEWALISYLARATYSFRGKYHLAAAVRRDGSSRFGTDNRWGVFPSVSGSWVISEESFFPQTSFLSLAKVRASWGVTGNNNIGNYTQYALVGLGYNAIFGSNVVAGSQVQNLGNSELGWERTSQIDIGLDIGFFKNRVNLIYDYYNKTTSDLLYSFDIPQSSGYSSFTGNTGEFNFWGHEISIQSRNLVGEFRWTTDLMVTFADNKVVSLADNVEEIITGGHITRVGDRIGLFWGLIKDGLYWDQEDYDSSPKAGASAVGTIKFKDVNGDGVITNSNTGDRAVIGDPTPRFLFGMTNTFLYKNFDLTITMSGSYGNDIANRYDQGTTNLDGVFNIKKEIKDRWRSPENPGSGKYGTTSTGTYMERDWFNSRFIEDGSYISIKNLTLGYTFKTNSLSWLSNLRLYGSIQQLATFTKYSGNNPEVSQSTNILTLGDDNAMYPIPRTFTVGINVDF